MPTVAIQNLGCKVNQYESDRIAESFAALGFELGDFRGIADVYVINGCSVTSDADRKSRQTAARAARQNPDAKVVVTGCYAQMALDTGESVPAATLLVPNREKMRTAARVLEAFPDLMQYSGAPSTGDALFAESAPGGWIDRRTLFAGASPHRTRATIKVQDGCRYYCAFCSIPFTRNLMASRPLNAIVDEARRVADQGVREVVITGVCVGAYGAETGSGGARLVDVITAVADVDGIERVRLSSVQPVEVPDDLIDAMAGHPNIAHHLHLSLQSGNDDVLRAMNRPYETAYFADRVGRIRSRIPDVGLTTDIIVGFPGETEAMFENTVAFAERMRFARTHVFRYSPRQRTAAADLADDVPFDEKERRHRRLTAVCLDAQKRFARELIGKTTDALIEARGNQADWRSGYTTNYVRVQVAAAGVRQGEMVRVLVEDVLPEGDAFGRLATE